ncbi:MAG: lipid-A-disaccharide synthase [Pseudomonadota bacterium]
MTSPAHKRVYFVIGEESGDRLGADLVASLKAREQDTDFRFDFMGLAGPKMQQLGVKSLFDIDDVAVMGLSAVLARLPLIIRRIRQTVRDVLEQAPDMLVIIDSPEFTHAVARRVRKARPDIAIINYVCPSVWAWRSGRAKKMSAYIDHVLTLLPFEPQALQDLDGPAATYVGHPLANQIVPPAQPAQIPESPTLVVLPGSRGGEINRHMPIFGETLSMLRARGMQFEPVIISLPHRLEQIEAAMVDWSHPAAIVSSDDEKAEVLKRATASLAASGTVTLEIALHHIPMVVGYKLDFLARLALPFIKVWTSVLPNLVVDYALLPEYHNQYLRPNVLLRHLERLLSDTPQRAAQLEGFGQLTRLMKTEQPAGERAAEVVINHLS